LTDNLQEVSNVAEDECHAQLKIEKRVIDTQLSRLSTLIKNSVVHIGECIAKDAAVVQDLQSQINGMDTQGLRTTSVSSSMDKAGRLLGEMNAQLNNLQSNINEMDGKVNQLISDATKDAVKYCKLGIRQAEDAFAWMDVHQPDFSFGLIIDTHIVFKHC
jgi:methyl-accepting chemotaxis protein